MLITMEIYFAMAKEGLLFVGIIFVFIGIPCMMYDSAKDIKKRDKWVDRLFIMFTLLIVIFHLWATYITKAPLDVPISLAHKGSIDTIITAPISENYDLCLEFDVDDKNLRRKFFEDEAEGKGVKIPIQWEIYLSSGELVKRGVSVTSKSHGGGVISRDIGWAYLKDGKYRLLVYVLEDIPELADFEARIIFSLGSYKLGTSWQKFVIFWLWIVLGPIILFIYFILLILLVYKKIKKFYHGRKK